MYRQVTFPNNDRTGQAAPRKDVVLSGQYRHLGKTIGNHQKVMPDGGGVVKIPGHLAREHAHGKTHQGARKTNA